MPGQTNNGSFVTRPFRRAAFSRFFRPANVIHTTDDLATCLQHEVGNNYVLALFDLDNTLVRAKKILARDEAFRQMLGLVNFPKALSMYHSTQKYTPVGHVDQRNVGMLKKFARMPNVLAMGFTNRGHELEWPTAAQLTYLGLQFSGHPFLRDHVLPHSGAHIADSVLFGSGKKHEAFAELIEHVQRNGFPVRRVIAADDTQEVLQKLANTAQEIEISFTGFRVNNCDEEVTNLNVYSVANAMREFDYPLLTADLLPRVYLAGPDVFDPESENIGKEKKQKLARAGFEGIYPADTDIVDFAHDEDTASRIFAANTAMMDRSQIIFANMTPWHGPSTDCGTAFEMGYMCSLAKRDPRVLLMGYYDRQVLQPFSMRVAYDVYRNKVTTAKDGTMTGSDGKRIENFGKGMRDNLMLQKSIEASGGSIFSSFDAAVSALPEMWREKQQQVESMCIASEQKTRKARL